MKRSLFSCAAVVVAMFATDASALYTRCEISYQTETLGLILGEIGSGRGRATCWDGFGNEYESRFTMGVIGPAARIGVCNTRGRISAAGAGIEFTDVLSAMGDFDFGPHIGRGRGVGGGARINLVGGGGLYASDLRYSGPCMGLGSVKFRLNSSIPPMRPTRRRSTPPPMPAQYDRDRRDAAPAIAGPARRAPPVAGPVRGRPDTSTSGGVIVDEDDDGVIVDSVMR